MDLSLALDHFAERRDLLSAYLSEYMLLHNEHPEVTDVLTFDGYVQFSGSVHAQRHFDKRVAGLERQLQTLYQ